MISVSGWCGLRELLVRVAGTRNVRAYDQEVCSRIGFLVLAVFVLVSAATSADFVIASNHVGKLALGMPEAEIYRLYSHLRMRKVDLQLEGNPTPAVEIYMPQRTDDPALVVRLSVPGDRIEGIEVHDSQFVDEAGIHVGSSFGQLRSAHRKLQLAVGEGQYWAALEDAGLSFRLRIDRRTEATLNGADDLSKIPASTPVVSIWVFAARSAHI